jgi:ketosteroid isomerase-like protein
MCRGIPLIVLAVACSSSPLSKAPTTGTGATAEQELARLERDWGEALGRRDTAFFNRVMADDFLQTGDAKTGTKQEFLKSLAGPPSDNLRYQLSETVIRQFGPAAVVSGLVTFPSLHRQSRYTEVWTKESGQWRVHHGHYNDLPPAAGSKRGADGDTLDIYLHHVAAGTRQAYEQWMTDVWEPAFRKGGDVWAPNRLAVEAERVLRPTRPDRDGSYTYVYLFDPMPSDTAEAHATFPETYLERAGYSKAAAAREGKRYLSLILRDEGHTQVQRHF